MKPGYLISTIVLVVSAIVTLLVFSTSMARHVSMAEVYKQPGATVQVAGKIDKTTVLYDAPKQQLQFEVAEIDGPGRMKIVYHEPKPENFDSATKVEAVGQYRDGLFHATNLLIQCPSKYNDEKKVSAIPTGTP